MATTAAAKSKPVSTHPSTYKMLMEALETNEDKKGMSVQAIKTFIMDKHPTVDPNMIKYRLKKALEKGIGEGLIKRPKAAEEAGASLSGRYKLDKVKIAANEKAAAKKREKKVKAEAAKTAKTAKTAKVEKRSRSKSPTKKPVAKKAKLDAKDKTKTAKKTAKPAAKKAVKTTPKATKSPKTKKSPKPTKSPKAAKSPKVSKATKAKKTKSPKAK